MARRPEESFRDAPVRRQRLRIRWPHGSRRAFGAPHHEGLRPHPEEARSAVSKDEATELENALGTIHMPAKEPTWTVERVELLKSRFTAGLSCREIAADIGVSRNAVIGKLSRLSLTRENERRCAAHRRKEAAKGRPRWIGAEAPISDAASAVPRAAAGRRRADPSEHCCSLLELSEARCRWPISTPGEKDFCFCGNTPVEGLPYCAGHARLAYRPGSRQRVARG